ncbi:MAG: hypothetical protein Q9157_004538 [Trypethelium eluteriae]
MEQDRGSIRATARACLGGFSSLFDAINRATAENCKSMPPDKIEREFGRFKIWCGNLGALQSGNSSLDSRLRESTVLRINMLEHLATLDQTLIKSVEVVSGARLPLEKQPKPEEWSDGSSSEESDGDDEPPKELILHMVTIKEILDDLYKFSLRIRNISIRSSSNLRPMLFKEVDPETGIDKFTAYTVFDKRHVEDSLLQFRRDAAAKMKKNALEVAQITDADQYLISRLVTAINIRRKTLRYWQRHAQKLVELPKDAKEVIKPRPQPELRAAQVEVDVAPEKPERTRLSENEANRFDKRLDDGLETESVISYASTAVDSYLYGNDVDLPAPPTTALKEPEFLCPYCGIICPLRYGKHSTWRAHILHDLQPYICTYRQCNEENLLFSSSTTWLEHERLGHRRIWQCFEHADPEFSSRAALQDHLQSEHGNDITKTQILNLVEVSGSTIAETRTSCPFCFLEAPFNKKFEDHVASHMQAFAVYSLSRNISDPEENDTGSNESELARTQGFGSLDSITRGPLQFDSHPLSNATSDVDGQAFRSPSSSIWNAGSPVDDGFATTAFTVRQDLKHHEEIMQWLSPANFHGQYHDIISRRQPGTAQWFLDSEDFNEWLQGSHKILFCPGIPGSGKTVIAAVAIEYLCQTTHSDNIGVAFLFCNWKTQVDQSVPDLLAAIAKQLVQSRPHIAAPVTGIYDRHLERGTKPSLDELMQVLLSICSSYSTVIVAELKPNHLTLEVRASEEDIKRYFIGQIPRLPDSIQHNEFLLSDMFTEIVKAADGMFLLARLHFDSFLDKRNKQQVLSTLDKLMKKPAELGEVHDEEIKRIDRQHEEDRLLARRTLCWISYAQRPLATTELCNALAIIPDDQVVDVDNPYDLKTEDIISVCAGLVTVDDEGGIIHFTHYTARDYLERIRLNWNPTAQEAIAVACLTYLSFHRFKSGSCPSDESFKQRRAENQFLDYSAHHWSEHVRPVQQSDLVSQLAITLLRCDKLVDSVIQAASVPVSKFDGHSKDFPSGTKGLHLTARYGLQHLTQRLLVSKLGDSNIEVDPRDSYDRTPMSYAAEGGHETVVKLLVDAGADVNAKGGWYGNALQAASLHGYEAVVKLLLEKGADVNIQGGKYGDALQAGSRNGHEVVVKLLLDAGADVNAQGGEHSNALQVASLWGHEAVVKLLLDAGAVGQV